MEQDKQNLLEMIDRPAFVVQEGIIVHTNQIAKNRMIRDGAPITDLLVGKQLDAYQAFSQGCLYLSLDFIDITVGATVTRQAEGDVFLLDRDPDLAKLQTLALAGQQLRQPLNTVMLMADELLPLLETDPEKAEMAGQLNKGLFQLLRIVSNMADGDRYAHIKSYNLEMTELASFLRETMQKAQTMLEDGQVKLHYEGLERAVFSLVERELLERGIYNMISNAVKFSPQGSTVEVKAVRTGDIVRLCVENAGEGISSHIQGSLFHRYQREPAIEDSRYGLGLGMSIIRAAAAAHDGTVLVDRPEKTRVTMTVAIRKAVPGELRSPTLRICGYAGGRDSALVELSDTLPSKVYLENL